MSTFIFQELATDNEVIQACLGTAANAKLNDNDVGKPVKLGTAHNYVLCAVGNEIEGFVDSINPETYNDGFSFGGVATEGRKTCKVDSTQTGTLIVGEYVVSGTTSAANTADAYPLVVQGTPTNFKWRVIENLTGTGVAGDLVLIEKVGS
jgi:hypothetical protein